MVPKRMDFVLVWPGLVGLLFLVSGCASQPQPVVEEVSSQEQAGVEFKREPGRLHITVGGNPFATYVYFDEEIPRPYFTGVKTPAGIQVTRNHPPIAGKDEMDHATYHPGIWMTFGDISGMDYWRLKSKVEHEMFLGSPSGGPSKGTFSVRNYYMDEEGTNRVAAEVAEFTLLVTPQGYLLTWDSTFTPIGDQIAFGDQEEMGLGFRTQTPISVDYGGRMVDSEGRKNEDEIWGTQGDWVDYSGDFEGKWIGIAIMQHPENFRKSWYHARNYGFIAANPFGRKAMKAGPESQVVVKEGDELRLRYGVLVHSSDSENDLNLREAYQLFLGSAGSAASGG